MKRILTVVLIAAAMMDLGSTAAFADQPSTPGSPGDTPGPNSGRANGQDLSNAALPGYNFGNCLPQLKAETRYQGNASAYNPSIDTGAKHVRFQVDYVCPKG
jgi:hypothetical protein